MEQQSAHKRQKIGPEGVDDSFGGTTSVTENASHLECTSAVTEQINRECTQTAESGAELTPASGVIATGAERVIVFVTWAG